MVTKARNAVRIDETPPWADGQPITLPSEPWSEIVPNLWQGGDGERPSATSFDVVLTLSESTYKYAPVLPGLTDHYWPIVDGLSTPPLLPLLGWARQVERWWTQGKRVLVRCQAGLNRSGLVVGLALAYREYEPRQVVAMLRERRSEFALCNPEFKQIVMESEVLPW